MSISAGYKSARGGSFPVVEAAVFLLGSALMFGVVYAGIPWLVAAGVETVAAWMILAVKVVFLPVIVCGVLMLRSENGGQSWVKRLWLERPTARDWGWGAAGLVGIAALSGAMFVLCQALGLDPNPPFQREAQPWVGERAWLFALWAVYWPVNILGEEFVWRGVLLPRMEARLGGRAWLLNALLWGVFHLAFGLGNLLVLLPTLLIVPFVAQRRRNTWLGVLLHAGISGPGFVALALGLM